MVISEPVNYVMPFSGPVAHSPPHHVPHGVGTFLHRPPLCLRLSASTTYSRQASWLSPTDNEVVRKRNASNRTTGTYSLDALAARSRRPCDRSPTSGNEVDRRLVSQALKRGFLTPLDSDNRNYMLTAFVVIEIAW